jgi:acyl-CoA thioesterase I
MISHPLLLLLLASFSFSQPDAVLPAPPISEPPTIVFLGDSLTEGYGITQSQAYPALVADLLKKKNISAKIVNAGISGSTSASADSRLRWFLKRKPDLLFLALGANDGLRGLDVSDMKKNLENVILMAKKEEIPVIIAGMKIPMNYGNDYRKKYEAVFPALAKKYSLPLIPFLLDGVATHKDLNISDGIHPNEKGHAIIAKNILPVIEKSLKSLKVKNVPKN